MNKQEDMDDTEEQVEENDDDEEEEQETITSTKKLEKTIPSPDQPIQLAPDQRRDILKKNACTYFKCAPKQVKNFTFVDPFLPTMHVEGLKCSSERGKMGGSLWITRVNHKFVPQQLIFGTPKVLFYNDW